MSSSIWTSPSQYGTCSTATKPVSDSTAYRWSKEGRKKTRRSSTLKIKAPVVSSFPMPASRPAISEPIVENVSDPWANWATA